MVFFTTKSFQVAKPEHSIDSVAESGLRCCQSISDVEKLACDFGQIRAHHLEPLKHRSDICSHFIAASPSAVFAAISDPDRVTRRWGPDGFSSTMHTFDFQNGGSWVLTMHAPDGTDYPNEKRFARIVPDRLWEIEHLNGHHFTLTVELKFSVEGTEVGWRQTFAAVEHYQALATFVAAANQQDLERLAAEVLR